MTENYERRADQATAKKVSRSIEILVEFGFDKASEYLRIEGVPSKLTDQVLLLRFDRRKRANAQANSHGFFRCSVGEHVGAASNSTARVAPTTDCPQPHTDLGE